MGSCSSSTNAEDKRKDCIEATYPTVPRIVAGWLRKEGQTFKSWKKRFFILKQGVLSYYENEAAMSDYHKEGSNIGVNQKGELSLLHYVVEEPESDHILLRPTNNYGRKLLLCCNSDAQKREWVEKLNAHILYLTELQVHSLELCR